MSIPKLKVYRLDQSYTTSTDDDIQSIENDELLPVVPKDLNVFNAEELVGVTGHREARLVYRPGTEYFQYLPMYTEADKSKSNYKTESFKCNRMVTGQSNYNMYIRSVLKIPDTNLESLTSDKFIGYAFPDDYSQVKINLSNLSSTFAIYKCDSKSDTSWTGKKLVATAADNSVSYGWEDTSTAYENIIPSGYSISEDVTSDTVELNKYYLVVLDSTKTVYYIKEVDFWKKAPQTTFRVISTTSKNGYTDTGDIADMPINATSFHQDDYYYVEIGDTIYKQTSLWGDGTSGYDETSFYAFGTEYVGGIVFCYQKYNELSSAHSSSDVSIEPERASALTYGVSFGNVYNGNKSGRFIKASGSSASSNSMYEGNYSYKRAILPLRFLVGKSSDSSDTTYAADAEIITTTDSSYCEFTAHRNWYIDGDFKPIVMELRTDTDGSKYFVPMVEETQINTISPSFEDDGTGKKNIVKYKVTFMADYYRKGVATGYAFPKEVFLFYNEVDDRLANLFDFDYEYGVATSSNGLAFKESNKGLVYRSNDNDLTKIYKKREILAVDENYGYDSTRDLLLVIDNVGVGSVTIPKNLVQYFDRTKEGTADFTKNNPKIYFNGVKVYDGADLTDSGYTTTFTAPTAENNGSITIVPSEGHEVPKDLMIVYYEEHDVGFSQTDNQNPWCYGYRVVCYEKTKIADLFVSSHPNWVNGHLNNNVDVFIGNTKYSGTDTSTYTTDGIYPCYQEDGYNIYYTEGAVKLTEAVEQLDYTDIRNFAGQISSKIAITNATTDADLKIYYNKVIANYAYYDGLFNVLRGRLSCYSVQNGGVWYAMLEDDFYEDSQGKRIVIHTDDYIRMLFECGTVELPEILNSDRNKREVCTPLTEFDADAKSYEKINTQSDRMTIINFTPSENSDSDLILLLNRNYSGVTATVAKSEFNDTDWVRIHINWQAKVKYALKTGKVNEYEIVDDDKTEAKPCMVIGMEKSGETDDDYFKRKVDWTPMPEQANIFADVTDISEVQAAAPIYKYENDTWAYDVYFELFSVRKVINSDTKSESVTSVEFAVYRVDKE